MIIAIKTEEGRMIFAPPAEAMIHVGDTLIAVGQSENVEKLVKKLGADTSPYIPAR